MPSFSRAISLVILFSMIYMCSFGSSASQNLSNLEQFGGKADYGISPEPMDNVKAFQTFESGRRGQCLNLGPGSYFFSSTISVKNAPLCIIGAGKEITRIVFGETATDGLDLQETKLFREHQHTEPNHRHAWSRNGICRARDLHGRGRQHLSFYRTFGHARCLNPRLHASPTRLASGTEPPQCAMV